MKNLRRVTHVALGVFAVAGGLLAQLDGLVPSKPLRWAMATAAIVTGLRANWGKIVGYTPSQP